MDLANSFSVGKSHLFGKYDIFRSIPAKICNIAYVFDNDVDNFGNVDIDFGDVIDDYVLDLIILIIF